jgi:exosortase
MALTAARWRLGGLPAVPAWPKSAFFAALGLLALAVPTLVTLASQYWTTEDGVHGPIILATGLWLIWREREVIIEKAAPTGGWLWVLPFLALSAAWVFAYIFSMLSVVTASFYLIMVLAGVVYLGFGVMRRLWFPVLYLAFVVRPPGSFVDEMTQPLKIWISGAAVDLLHLFGYPVAHTGAIIQVAQYQLLVADACAGLASLFSLTAIGLLYVHLSWGPNIKRAVILILAIIPLAVVANLIRVVVLALLTYHAGSKVAQGVMHDMAGIITFGAALAGMLAVDAVVSRVISRGAAQ